MAPTLAIFPAAGALGSSTVNHLIHTVRYPASSLILVNRNPDKTPDVFTAAGASVRQASYESSTEELQSAFSGAQALFLISYPDYNKEYRIQVHFKAIDAARAAGIKHIFYSSLAYAGSDAKTSKAVVMQAHLATEARLSELKLDAKDFSFTSIREGIYSESFPMYTGFLDLSADVPHIRHPHRGGPPGVAWVKRDELGEATARIIQRWTATEDTVRNKVILLSGPKVWSLDETVQLLKRLTGKHIVHDEITIEEYIQQEQVQKVLGKDQGRLQLWATSYAAIRDGECAVMSSALTDLLGRQPEDFETTVSNMLKEDLGTYKHKQKSQ